MYKDQHFKNSTGSMQEHTDHWQTDIQQINRLLLHKAITVTLLKCTVGNSGFKAPSLKI